MISLTDCTAGYGLGVVLDKVRMTIPEGAVVGVLGANGSGKSTLVRAFAGLLPEFEGVREVDGIDRSTATAQSLRDGGIALVPEGRGIFGRLSVIDNLRLGYRKRSSSFDTLFDQVSDIFPILGNRRKQTAGTLSGGEQQMLAIGRALMGEPRYLLVDEPSLGLAPKIISEIFACFRAFADEKQIGVLLAEQDLRVRGIVDEVHVLHMGSIVASGPPSLLDSEEDVFAMYRGDLGPSHEV